jgi:hypothetical protein
MGTLPMGDWLDITITVLKILVPIVLWMVWWLWAVNWKHAWPALAKGGWAPVVLLIFLSAEAWSRINPESCNSLGFMSIPNFWWQLGCVSALITLALFCGWLQGVMSWTPPEIPVNPEPPAGDFDHGHVHH